MRILNANYAPFDSTIASWLMNGNKMVSVALTVPSAPSDYNWRVVGMDDMNHDGKSDLVFQHSVTGELVVWFMNGLRLENASYLNPSYPGENRRVQVIADFNGDGSPDLIFRNGSTLAIWLMNDTKMISGDYLSTQSVSEAWSVVGPR